MDLIFKWSKDYETKISEIDEQHYYLVTLTNEITSKMSQKSLSKNEIDEIFEKLIDYAKCHFEAEETLMKEENISADFINDHIKNHQIFVENVLKLYSEVKNTDNKEIIKNLLEFLISWLGFHILGQDKIMGEQIALIKEGTSPEDAYEIVMQSKADQTAPLLKTLNILVDEVVKRNEELLEIKQNLELKIKERTHELAQKNKTLKTIAVTDPLTNLANRRYLLEVFDLVLCEAKEKNIPTSGLMIDLDNFKEVNDNFGHEMGDKVLIAFSNALKDTIRTSDIAVRLGGDEFFVLLPGTSLEGATVLANNLINVIRSLNVQVGKLADEKWKSSVSIGLASILPNEISTAGDFMKKSDIAVYEAKKAGKNCVKIYKN